MPGIATVLFCAGTFDLGAWSLRSSCCGISRKLSPQGSSLHGLCKDLSTHCVRKNHNDINRVSSFVILTGFSRWPDEGGAFAL